MKSNTRFSPSSKHCKNKQSATDLNMHQATVTLRKNEKKYLKIREVNSSVPFMNVIESVNQSHNTKVGLLAASHWGSRCIN